MNRFETVLKTKVLCGVLVAGMALPAVAGVPMEAQWRGGGGQGYAQSYRGYGGGYRGGNYGQGYAPSGYRGGYYGGSRNDLRYGYDDRHHGVGPGTGALIGGAAGVVLGGILGGGKGALIGGAAGAGVGAAAGAANRDAHRGYGYGNGYGYNGYGYSNRGDAYANPYRY